MHVVVWESTALLVYTFGYLHIISHTARYLRDTQMFLFTEQLTNMINVAAFTVLVYYDSYTARLVRPTFHGLLSLNSFQKKNPNKPKPHRSKPQQMLESFLSETFKLHLPTFHILYEVP